MPIQSEYHLSYPFPVRIPHFLLRTPLLSCTESIHHLFCPCLIRIPSATFVQSQYHIFLPTNNQYTTSPFQVQSVFISPAYFQSECHIQSSQYITYPAHATISSSMSTENTSSPANVWSKYHIYCPYSVNIHVHLYKQSQFTSPQNALSPAPVYSVHHLSCFYPLRIPPLLPKSSQSTIYLAHGRSECHLSYPGPVSIIISPALDSLFTNSPAHFQSVHCLYMYCPCPVSTPSLLVISSQYTISTAHDQCP